MTQWLIDTFIYTGLLIALVLLVRRPVSRHFGPQVAYALWALPLLRLLMPPLVLPASMAPAAVPAEPAGEAMVLYLTEATANASEAAVSAPPQIGIALIDLLVPLWLAGAGVFLTWRARDYLAMRRDLLEDARPVGEAGKVRLVETPAVSSPVAFGIGDKVIALPPAFMAHHDIAARDMAIAHELAHHRGYDLVANIAAQPLLALHWFNPLAWWGWRAMRRDQEAACDARVVAGRQRSERAAYAQVIAGFAAGPHLALAAPMACPVLGEKSIIHRLRSLTMTDVSSRRKKLGLAAIATTALVALPVTASITYAQEDADEVPVPPAPPAAPDALAPPAAPNAPLPPVPPSIESIDPDGTHRTISVQVSDDGEGNRNVRRMVINRDGDVREFSEREFAAEAEMEAMILRLGAARQQRANAEIAFAEAQLAREEASNARAEAELLAALSIPEVEVDCDGTEVVRHRATANGNSVMVICQTAATNMAALALRQARDSLEHNVALSARQRQELIRELDAAIAEMEARKVSSASEAKIRMVAPVRHFEAKAHVPAVPAVPQPPRVLRTSAASFGKWQAAAPVDQAAQCDEEEDGRFTT